jgi:hypothetical protein
MFAEDDQRRRQPAEEIRKAGAASDDDAYGGSEVKKGPGIRRSASARRQLQRRVGAERASRHLPTRGRSVRARRRRKGDEN